MAWFNAPEKKEYRVTLEYEELVTPEETLIDASSQHADIEQPIGVALRFLGRDFVRRIVGVVVAFGRDAERLEGCILVGRAHGLVRRLVAAVHRLTERAGRDLRPVRG